VTTTGGKRQRTKTKKRKTITKKIETKLKYK
jgi:hypothetical protein